MSILSSCNLGAEAKITTEMIINLGYVFDKKASNDCEIYHLKEDIINIGAIYFIISSQSATVLLNACYYKIENYGQLLKFTEYTRLYIKTIYEEKEYYKNNIEVVTLSNQLKNTLTKLS